MNLEDKINIAIYSKKIAYNEYFIIFLNYIVCIMILTIISIIFLYPIAFGILLIHIILTGFNAYYKFKINMIKDKYT